MRKLRDMRLERGLSQGELAERAGLGALTVNQIETGKRPRVRPQTMRKLAQGLGVDVSELYAELGGGEARWGGISLGGGSSEAQEDNDPKALAPAVR